MEFTQDDRDMLKAHDQKLQTLCGTTSNMDTLLNSIYKKLNTGAVGCVENRANCRKEIDEKFVKNKTFWIVITVIVIGFVGKMIVGA